MTGASTAGSARPRWRVGLWLVLGLVACGLAVRLVQVHDQTWEWRLMPRPLPAKVMFHDRTYTCCGDTLTALPDGVELVGHTPGGAELYTEPPGPGDPSTVMGLYARDGNRIVVYGLLGGP